MHPKALQIRQTILHSSRISGHGHIPTSFSVVEMLMAVYEIIKHDPANPIWPERDIFVLSKGHASLGLYSVLAHYGYFAVKDVESFGSFMSKFGCHPDRFKVPGVEVSTGSLGHGICVAAGMALAFKMRHTPQRVYTLIGDGESNEGTVWETAMVAQHLGLDNLTVLFDNNKSQSRSLPVSNPGQRFAAFGFKTLEVDGHALEQIKWALTEPTDRPKAIICNTIKGYGSQTLAANVYEWHRKSPNAEQYEMLLGELHATAVQRYQR